MARSKEAIKRRAEKRQRSEAEQWKVEDEDRRKKSRQATTDPGRGSRHYGSSNAYADSHSAGGDGGRDERMKEAGAWKCRQCGNDNFASRRYCYSHTCDEPRPRDAPFVKSTSFDRKKRQQRREPGVDSKKEVGAKHEMKNFASRDSCHNREGGTELPPSQDQHGQQLNTDGKEGDATGSSGADGETAAVPTPTIWADQAGPSTLKSNQDLRKQYLETSGEGMTEDDIARAKILIARDERRRKKKLAAQQWHGAPIATAQADLKEPTRADEDKTKKAKKKRKSMDQKAQNKALRDSNKALREKYAKTGGEGMKRTDIDRAKMLIARDERKKQERLRSSKIESRGKSKGNAKHKNKHKHKSKAKDGSDGEAKDVPSDQRSIDDTIDTIHT